MRDIINQLIGQLSGYLPSLVGALVILALGLVLAPLVAALVRAALHRSGMEKSVTRWAFGDDMRQTTNVERWIARIFFYLVLLFVLVAFFQALGLTLVTEPLSRVLDQLFTYLPRIFGALVLLLIAWILASLVRILVRSHLLVGTRTDRWIADVFQGREKRESLNHTLSEAAYWLVFLLFVPVLLDTLDLEGLLEPVKLMFNKILVYVPNIVGALLILFVGWFFARVIQRVVANLLSSVGVEQLSRQAGISQTLGPQGLSGLIGLAVYVLILIPVLIASLHALELQAITGPAAQMLGRVMGALPNIFAAGLLVLISYLVARIVGSLLASLLGNAGFDSLPARLGLGKRPRRGERQLSEVARVFIVAGITLLATMEALRLLGFLELAELVKSILLFAGQILVALVIVAVGLYLANLAVRAIRASKTEYAPIAALVTRTAIIILTGAMALRQTGLASDIINLAFGILLSGVVVTLAIAFGVGGREIAARKLEEWLRRIK